MVNYGKSMHSHAKAIEDKDGNKGIVTQSIIIYKLTTSEKGYQIYNLFQVGVVAPKSDSDRALDRIY